MLSSCLIHLPAIDPSLGRLDYYTMSDQSLMEMLVDGMYISKKQRFMDSNGNFRDISEWKYSLWNKWLTCENDRVTKIAFQDEKFTVKQFPFEFIPGLVGTFIASRCNLKGTLDTSLLPRALRRLKITHSELTGSIDCKGLPQTLMFMEISDNAFDGSLVLSDLPDGLTEFFVPRNHLSGGISFDNLPSALAILDLSENKLTGPISINALPPKVGRIDLSWNNFSGDLRLLTAYRGYINICGNLLSGTAVLFETDGDMPFILSGDNISKVLDWEGHKHAWHERISQICSG